MLTRSSALSLTFSVPTFHHSSSSVNSFVSVCSHVFVYVWVCMCTRAHRPGQHQESFSISPLIPKTRPPHWTWSSSIGWLGWFPMLSKDPLLPILPQCWDVNLGPYTFTANTLPTMHLPSSRTLSIPHQASYTSKVTTVATLLLL